MVAVKIKREQALDLWFPPSRSLMSMGYVLERDGHAQGAGLVVQTEPGADQGRSKERPEKPERHLDGKQARDPLLPRLLRPLQQSDAELLESLEPLEERCPEPGGHDEWEPTIEDEWVGPALRLLRAGGWPLDFESRLLQEGCRGAGGVCEATVSWRRSDLFPGRALCPMALTLRLQDQPQQEHAKAAVGEEDGLDQGFMLEFLRNQVSPHKDYLSEDQCEHDQMRPEGGEVGGPTSHAVLQTCTVPLAQVMRDVEAWNPHWRRNWTCCSIPLTPPDRWTPKTEPGYKSMQTAPSKLVPSKLVPTKSRPRRQTEGEDRSMRYGDEEPEWSREEGRPQPWPLRLRSWQGFLEVFPEKGCGGAVHGHGSLCSLLSWFKGGRAPKKVLELAEHLLGYLLNTLALERKKADQARKWNVEVAGDRVDVYSDAPFSPNGDGVYWKLPEEFFHLYNGRVYRTSHSARSRQQKLGLTLGHTEGLTLARA